MADWDGIEEGGGQEPPKALVPEGLGCTLPVTGNQRQAGEKARREA